MRLQGIVAGFTGLLLAACATTDERPPLSIVQVGYLSTPAGAEVILKRSRAGLAPLLVNSKELATYARDSGACITTGPVTFKWKSGASVTIAEPVICRDQLTVIAVRPADAPGLDQDLSAEDHYFAKKRALRSYGANARSISPGTGHALASLDSYADTPASLFAPPATSGVIETAVPIGAGGQVAIVSTPAEYYAATTGR